MIIKEEKCDDLQRKQIKTIDKLQEEIKLLKFDVSKNLSVIRDLKGTLKRRNQTIERARQELYLMKRQNDYSNINYVIFMLKEMDNEK